MMRSLPDRWMIPALTAAMLFILVLASYRFN
jgi:hypothetical protein